MWIWRSEYDKLKQKIYDLEFRREILQERVTALEASNLSLQDLVHTYQSAQSIRKMEDDPFGADPMAEDESEIQRLIQAIKRDGRDTVIAREG